MGLARTFKRSVSFVVCLAMMMGIVFASSGVTARAAETAEKAETSVITLTVGEELQLVVPTGKNTWSSSDSGIVTVDKGRVTAIAAGEAEVTVTNVSGILSFIGLGKKTVTRYSFSVIEKEDIIPGGDQPVIEPGEDGDDNQEVNPDIDFDGIPNDLDPNPESPVQTGRMTGYYGVEGASYTLDLREFFGDNKSYSRDMASASLQLANAIYVGSGFEYETPDGIRTIEDINEMLEYHGFDGATTYLLGKDDGSDCGKIILGYEDDAISEFAIAHKDVAYNGDTKRIIAVVVRGSNGTIEEWSNNFDIGNRNEEIWESGAASSKDQTTHKGFYLTEQRILKEVNSYIEKINNDAGKAENSLYWITGHSRGASIANLLAKDLVDSGRDVFAYTFAAAANTVAADHEAERYDCIFNIVNTSDVVPALPFKQWGFGRYGKTIDLSIEDYGLSAEWSEKTGQCKYNPVRKSLIELAANRITKSCTKSWEDAFVCSDPQLLSKAQYNALTDREKRYCELKENKLGKLVLGYEMKPSTAFVFQLAAVLISGDERCSNKTPGVMQASDAKKMLAELWNSKFSAVLLLMCGDALGDIPSLIKNWPSKFDESLFGDGHAPATYYVLTDNYM